MTLKENDLLKIIDSVPVAVFAIDTDHRIIFWNKACERITGIPESDIIGSDKHAIAFYGHRKPVLADLVLENDTGSMIAYYSGKNLRKSSVMPGAWEASWLFENVGGKTRFLHFTAARVLNAEGVLIGSVSTVQEIEPEDPSLAISEDSNKKMSASENGRYGIIGLSKPMMEVYGLMEKAAGTDAGVIIYGESGSGKELTAKGIHQISGRRDHPFVPVNCGAIPENLLESEFFGYAKGAFTGAHADKPGFLDLADNGTLFLDEIGELNINLQVKLLRAIEGGGFSPVGSRQLKHSNFRIIAATNLDLANEMKSGRMRPDFFYRIHVIPIRVPSLKERKEDIQLLVSFFMKKFGSGSRTLPKKMTDAINGYTWPGNIRELQNVIQRYLVLKSIDFTGDFVFDEGESEKNDENRKKIPESVDELEKKLIVEALERNGFKRSKAALELGISRRTLYRKMVKFCVFDDER